MKYFNWSSDRDKAVDFLDFWIRDGDATVGPVRFMLQIAMPAEMLFDSVDHNRSTWLEPSALRSLSI